MLPETPAADVRRAHTDDPHTMTKPRFARGSARWVRECSCGWRRRMLTRETLMRESASHRTMVRNWRGMVRLGLGEFYVPAPPRLLTEEEKANMRAISAEIRRAFGGV